MRIGHRRCGGWGHRILEGALLLAGFQSASAQEVPTIRVGDRLEIEVAAERGELRWRVGAEPGTTVTAVLSSHDFEVVLRLEDGEGRVLGKAELKEEASDARLVFEVAPELEAVLVVPHPGKNGAFVLELRSGKHPAPTGTEGLASAIRFRVAVRERALAQGQVARAINNAVLEGTLRHRTGDSPGAESVLTWAQNQGDSEDEDLAVPHGTAASALGNLLLDLGRSDEAQALQQRALELFRRGEDRVREITTLGNLGNAYFRRSDFPRARDCYEQQRDLAREIEDRTSEFMACSNLGALLLQLGEIEDAQKELEHARELIRDLNRPAYLASILANLADLYHRTGRADAARRSLEEALRIAEPLGDRNLVALLLVNLGQNELSRGQLELARERLTEAIRLARDIGNRNVESFGLGNLGLTLRDLGEFVEAERVCRERLELCRRFSRPQGEAWTHWQLADVVSVRGRLGEAYASVSTALQMSRQLSDASLELRSLLTLSRLRIILGEWPETERSLESALEIAERLNDAWGLSEALLLLGRLAFARDRHEDAQRFFARAIEIDERAQQPTRLAADLRLLSHCLFLLGRVELAKGHVERALELARQTGNRRQESQLLAGLAACQHRLGDWESARASATQSRAICGELGLERDRLAPLSVLIECDLSEGKVEAAHDRLQEAERILDRPWSGLEVGQAELVVARWYSHFPQYLHDTLARAWGAQEASPEARSGVLSEGFEALGRWKARSLLQGLAQIRRGGRSPEARALREERLEVVTRLDGVSTRIEKATRARWESTRIDELRNEANTLRRREAELSDRLRAVSPREADLEVPRGLSISAVRERLLKPGDLLIDFIEGKTRLYAVVIGPAEEAFVTLGDWEVVEKAVDEFRASIARLAPADEIARQGSALYRDLLPPCLDVASKDVQRLVIVPSASLASLPFEALVRSIADDGDPQSFGQLEFVLDRFEVTYAPSVPVLEELRELGPRRRSGKLLILADPIYPSETVTTKSPSPGSLSLLGRGATTSPNLSSLARLPHTRRESFKIAEILIGLVPEDQLRAKELVELASERSGRFSANSLDLFFGSEASADLLQEDLSSYAILHLAAHGASDSESRHQTGLVVSAGRERDGFVAVEEVLQMQLDANLVVLSACNTARGESVGAEGMQSLARAFVFAGGRSVIASLWTVADAESAELMVGFYRQAFQAGQSPSRALLAAKRAMRRSKRTRGLSGVARVVGGPDGIEAHPFFWAPFIHIGR